MKNESEKKHNNIAKIEIQDYTSFMLQDIQHKVKCVILS